MAFPLCWQCISRPIGVKPSHRFAVIKRHRIEASSAKSYLCAQHPGKSHADGVQSPLFSLALRLRLLNLTSAKVIEDDFGPESNALFLR